MQISEPQIIYEDDAIYIINKPAGWVVNRADTTHHMTTIQDWIEGKSKVADPKPENKESDFWSRGGIVHRLDKDTSGVMIIAKTPESFTQLQAQFKKGEVAKTYIALVHGKVVPERGVIEVPIGRLPWNRMRFGVLPAGRESKTEYKVTGYKKFKDETASSGRQKYEEILTLIEAYPQTGRTHQIRVHFLHLGHPLFGDLLYGGRKTIRRDKKYITRHFLHAAKISFIHPTTHKRVTFESPLPQELHDLLDSLDVP